MFSNVNVAWPWNLRWTLSEAKVCVISGAMIASIARSLLRVNKLNRSIVDTARGFQQPKIKFLLCDYDERKLSHLDINLSSKTTRNANSRLNLKYQFAWHDNGGGILYGGNLMAFLGDSTTHESFFGTTWCSDFFRRLISSRLAFPELRGAIDLAQLN